MKAGAMRQVLKMRVLTVMVISTEVPLLAVLLIIVKTMVSVRTGRASMPRMVGVAPKIMAANALTGRALTVKMANARSVRRAIVTARVSTTTGKAVSVRNALMAMANVRIGRGLIRKMAVSVRNVRASIRMAKTEVMHSVLTVAVNVRNVRGLIRMPKMAAMHSVPALLPETDVAVVLEEGMRMDVPNVRVRPITIRMRSIARRNR